VIGCSRSRRPRYWQTAGITHPTTAILDKSAGTRVLLREFPHKGSRQISKRHGRLIRTGVRTCVAHLICEAARATAADTIGVETIIPRSDDQRAVAINIDTIRSRAAPGQIRSASSVYQVAVRTERDLAWRSCRRSRGRDGRGGGCRRSWRRCRSWACGKELEFADARKPASATGDRIIFVGVPET
jgi:hypothetical protein